HQPVGQDRLVEERLALVVRHQPVAGLDHAARGVEEVDLGARERRRPELRQQQREQHGAHEQDESGVAGGGQGGAGQGCAGAAAAAAPFLRWSWPHAARMSRPRGRRTDTGTSAAASAPQNASTASGFGALNGISAAGLSGIRFTLTRRPPSLRASSRACAAESFTPPSRTYSKVTRPPRGTW